MTKEEFKQLIQEHGEISLGLNAFDPSEITATYSVDLQGRVFEVYDDNTSWYVTDINDDAAMQKFEEEVLCDVVSHQYENNHFELCVSYIKANLENWEIEQGWSYIGKRIETIEISLKTFNIIQSRGVCNKNSKKHDEIVKLMKEHMGEVMALARPKRKKKATKIAAAA